MVEVESNVESNNCIQERVQDVENNDNTQYVLDVAHYYTGEYGKITQHTKKYQNHMFSWW